VGTALKVRTDLANLARVWRLERRERSPQTASRTLVILHLATHLTPVQIAFWIKLFQDQGLIVASPDPAPWS
jgi:hypothetical protein